MNTRGPEQVLLREGGEITLQRETEEGSYPERKKASRINLEKKVGFQGDQSSRKLLQQHSREQEIVQKEAPNSSEKSTFLEVS